MKDLPIWVQTLILAALIIVGTVVGHIYLLRPLKERITAQDKVLTDLRAENNKSADIEQRLPELEAEVKRLDERLTVLVAILPKALETDVVVNKIKGIADNYHIHILNLTPKPPVSKGLYSEFTIALDVRGTYHGLALFFDKIFKQELIMSVSDLALKRAAGKDAATTVDAKFAIATYTQ